MKDEMRRAEAWRGGGGEAGRSRDEARVCFYCESCGEAVREGEDCLILRVGGGGAVLAPGGGGSDAAVVRLCGECAGEPDTLAGHLDLVGARYFSGPAGEAEGWESLGR